MARITVAYFLAEHVPDLDLPLAGDLAVTTGAAGHPGWPGLVPLLESIAVSVARLAADGEKPVVICGECTSALGIVTGLQRAGIDPAVVWLDGHGDVQTLETTTSGFIGGMVLRLLVGYRPELAAEALGLRPVAERRVVLADARDLDPPEVDYLRQAQIKQSTVEDLSAEMLPEGPLYLHVDLDVVDPGDLAGLRYPAPGGPSWPEVREAMRRVLATERVVAIGLACTWYPGNNAAERVRADLEALLSDYP
jgi:arginase